jgi:lysophospholipase L1-like esterase
MGILASTRDSSAFIRITARASKNRPLRFQRVKIFHAQDSSTYAISFPNDIHAVLTRDSTNTYTLVEFSRVLDTLYLQLNEQDSFQHDFTLHGFRLENENPGLCLDAIGNNGADLPSYLKCGLFEQQLNAAMPDLVILSLGINDAYGRHFDVEYYKNNYRRLVERIRSVAPDCAILFTTNNDSYYRKRYPNANGAKVQAAIYELAAEYNAGVWDLFAVMGGYKSINTWVSARLARTDKIHFTNGGYQLLGTLLSEALMNAFIQYQEQPKAGD